MLKRLDYFWLYLEVKVITISKDSIDGESPFHCSE